MKFFENFQLSRKSESRPENIFAFSFGFPFGFFLAELASLVTRDNGEDPVAFNYKWGMGQNLRFAWMRMRQDT